MDSRRPGIFQVICVNKLLLSLFIGGALCLGVTSEVNASFRVHLANGEIRDITPAKIEASPTQEVLGRAMSALGKPYRWGGASPKRGFDCSGLVKYAFDDIEDLDLPRTSRELSRIDGPKVARNDLEPGDLLFFKVRSRTVDHVAIYLGEDRFIHAPRRGSNVRIDKLDNSYWQKRFQLARRVIPNPEIVANN